MTTRYLIQARRHGTQQWCNLRYCRTQADATAAIWEAQQFDRYRGIAYDYRAVESVKLSLIDKLKDIITNIINPLKNNTMITALENIMRLQRTVTLLTNESTDNSTTSEYKTLAIASVLDDMSRQFCDLARAAHAQAEEARTQAASKAATRKAAKRGSNTNNTEN